MMDCPCKLCNNKIEEQITDERYLRGHPERVRHLLKFYSTITLYDLIRAQSEHIKHLQDKLPELEDEFPRTPRGG